MSTSNSPPSPPISDDRDLFDYQLVRNVIGFIVRGLRRHPWVSLAVFVVVLSLGIGWMVLAPRTYHVETTLLASRSQLTRSLGNPRTIGIQAEDPTRAAQETVFARDNILSLIKQTNLLERMASTKPILARIRDGALALVLGPPTEEDVLDNTVKALEKRLRVTTGAQTVVISIDWPDDMSAYQLIETAQQNFLEKRHVTEMTAINEAISILEVHAAKKQRLVSDALQELERVREARRAGVSAGTRTWTEIPATALQASPPPKAEAVDTQPANEQELAQIKFLYQSKRRALDDLEDFRAKRMTELSAQLAEQRIQYAEKHPAIVDLNQRIAALKVSSPQMTELKHDVAELQAEYRRKGGLAIDSLVEPRRRTTPAKVVAEVQRDVNADLDNDPEVEFARNALRAVTAAHEELVMRIDSAHIEQDTARAAFKYRYSVVRPAALPKEPASPNLQTLGLLVTCMAAACALLSGAAFDRWRGTLVEPWQVTSQLGLPVLCEVTPA